MRILPQANDLDKVIGVFKYIYLHPDATKEDIADFCDFTTLRQVDYYANTSVYLKLLDDNWKPTALANYYFEAHRAEIELCVYEQIISDDLMGKIFAQRYLFPDDDTFQFARELTEQMFPGYSDSVYNRRSGNIVRWCDKIIKYMKIRNNQ